MLVAIGTISLVLAMGAVAFAEVIRLRGAQDRYNRRLMSADFLLRRIARDVRPGRAFLPARNCPLQVRRRRRSLRPARTR